VRDHSDQRLANLRCALAALRAKQEEPELQLLDRLLDTWSGTGSSPWGCSATACGCR